MKSKHSAGSTRHRLNRHFREFWPYYVMILPGLVFLILIKYIPMAGCVIAFKNFSLRKGIAGSPWVGLEHFRKLLNYDDFHRVFRNTLILGALKTILIFPVPIVLALMLNELRNALVKKSIQTVITIPHFISWVIVGGLTFDILGAGGLLNQIRTLLGMDMILPMQKSSWFRSIYVFTSIWKESGWGTVVYLAAISGIDPGLYESASIDGASRFQKMTRITFPMILPTAVTLFLINIGSFLDLGFDQVYNLYTPMTYNVADIFDTYVYRSGIQQGKYSFSTAVGLFQSVIGLILVLVFNRLSKKVSEDGGLW
ncbi:MAG: sugar ABC transporter permease [Clostridia bacterium]|nr:sugar ABC transporter permease [Clostridia bacterium]